MIVKNAILIQPVRIWANDSSEMAYYCLSDRVFRHYFHDLNKTYLNKNGYKFKLTLFQSKSVRKLNIEN